MRVYLAGTISILSQLSAVCPLPQVTGGTCNRDLSVIARRLSLSIEDYIPSVGSPIVEDSKNGGLLFRDLSWRKFPFPKQYPPNSSHLIVEGLVETLSFRHVGW